MNVHMYVCTLHESGMGLAAAWRHSPASGVFKFGEVVSLPDCAQFCCRETLLPDWISQSQLTVVRVVETIERPQGEKCGDGQYIVWRVKREQQRERGEEERERERGEEEEDKLTASSTPQPVVRRIISY
jgi:hypothetical protein